MKTLLWVVGEILLIFILLTMPSSDFSSRTKWFGNLPVDKIVHIFLFSSLALSFFFYFEQSSKGYLRTISAKACVMIFCILYGIGMEYYQQYFVPSRGFEVSDMLADAIGALLALPIFSFIRRKYN
ncbi:MAG: VanZ family protein [Sediminibacterium sp.]